MTLLVGLCAVFNHEFGYILLVKYQGKNSQINSFVSSNLLIISCSYDDEFISSGIHCLNDFFEYFQSLSTAIPTDSADNPVTGSKLNVEPIAPRPLKLKNA